MSLDWSRLAGASPAVGAALVIAAAVAWAVLWAQPEEEGWTRVAREHLAPLVEWALGFLALHALALIFEGDAGFGACGAAALHHPPAAEEPDAEPAEPAPAEPRDPDEEAAPRAGLWSR